MNVALILKGSISKISGRSNFPGIANNSDLYVDYCSGFNSIKKHIIDSNPEHIFDFFIHTWHPELLDHLNDLYNPKAIQVESNDIYREEIINKTISSGSDLSNYGQTSHCLSIKRGFDLIRKSNIKYDLVIFYRLDLLLWKNMYINKSNLDTVTINNFMEGNGDFHFIMNYEDADIFSNIYDYISEDLKPVPHMFFKDYILKYIKNPIRMDDICAGKDQEVIRKLKLVYESNNITEDILRCYNLTVEEINKYENGVF